MTKDDNMLTIPEFAEQIGVNRVTVSRWVQAGKVKGVKQGPFPGRTSPILIPMSELERVKALKQAQEDALSS